MVKKDGVYIMESAEIIGEVTIGEHSSVWSKAVIRADDAAIKIGKNTNIQDMCLIHTDTGRPLEIGDNVTIGHGAMLHCRRIGSNCIIGMGAMLLDSVEIGEYSVIAAGTVVTENKKIPPRSLVMGIPGKIVREIKDEDIKRIEQGTQDYLRLAKAHYEGYHKRIN
jgi:carbonic anhydrase/acetyltransferase-like protein (isoleucine patch superfamily)